MFVSKKYPVFRQMFLPFIKGFTVHFGAVVRITFEYCGIETVLVYLVDVRQKFPRP